MLVKALYRFNTIPTKILMTFHRTEANISNIYMEPQKAPYSNSDPKKEQSWRNHATLYQTMLQGHNNQQHMALA